MKRMGPMPATIPTGASVLERMDEAKLSRLHWKIMFISGMGFFTDAYDLFIIGVVMALLKTEWHISPIAEGPGHLDRAARFGGRRRPVRPVADMLGRKRIYGYEVLVLAVGAIASALSPNIWWLICFPDHPRHRHRRRLSRQFHHHERIRKQAHARPDGDARLHHAGGGPDRRPGCSPPGSWSQVCRTTRSGAFCWRAAPSPRWPFSRCADAWPRRRVTCSRPASTTPSARRLRMFSGKSSGRDSGATSGIAQLRFASLSGKVSGS